MHRISSATGKCMFEVRYIPVHAYSYSVDHDNINLISFGSFLIECQYTSCVVYCIFCTCFVLSHMYIEKGFEKGPLHQCIS